MSKPRRPRAGDVEISASVRARELTPHVVPRTEVERVAEPTGESGSGSDRTNLPDHVRAEETYRDIRVDYRVASELDGLLQQDQGKRDAREDGRD